MTINLHNYANQRDLLVGNTSTPIAQQEKVSKTCAKRELLAPLSIRPSIVVATMGVPFEALIPYAVMLGVCSSVPPRLLDPSLTGYFRCSAPQEPVSLK